MDRTALSQWVKSKVPRSPEGVRPGSRLPLTPGSREERVQLSAFSVQEMRTHFLEIEGEGG